MAPRHRRRVADEHDRDAEQRGAADVDLARNRQLGLVEALGVGPREVRVAEQQSVMVLRAGAADGDGVGAHLTHRLMPSGGEQPRDALRVGGRNRRRVRARRRRGLCDAGHDDVLPGKQRQLVEAQIGIAGRDRVHPLGTMAGRVLDAGGSTDIVQVAVVTGDVTLHGGEDEGFGAERRRTGEKRVDDLRLPHLCPEDVGVEVADRDAVALHRVGLLRPEPAAAQPFDRDVVGRHRADVVLRKRVAVAVTQRAVVLRDDVRNAVLSPRDGHVVLRCMSVGSGRRNGKGAQQGHRDYQRKASTHPPDFDASRAISWRRLPLGDVRSNASPMRGTATE